MRRVLAPAAGLSAGARVALAILVAQLGTPAFASAVEPPTVDGPVPRATGLASGPVRQDGPCRTTAAVLSPSSPPAAATAAELRDAWIHGRGEGQVVAVIDTGVNPGPRLSRVRGAGDVVPGRNGTEDCDAHGTLVAGVLAAAEDETGHSGIAPGVEIVSIRQSSSILRADSRAAEREGDPGSGDGGGADGAPVGTGGGVGTLATLATSIRLAVDAGADVINISEVACVPAGTVLADDPLGGAIRYAAVDHDVVVVAAAGNVGDTCGDQNPAGPDASVPGDDGWADVRTIASPAWYDDHVLTVGGVDPAGRPTDFSLRGPWVDVAAPAVDLRSVGADGAGVSDLVVDGDGARTPISGTSFAAPFVAGTAALVRQAHPGLTARQVIERIENTTIAAAGGHDHAIGHGVVDPVAAVTGVRRPGTRRPAPASTTLAAPSPEPGPPGAGNGALVAAGALALGAAALVVVVLLRPRDDSR
ncbi:type VII secretion-associated serine protease mycosin [Dietzia aurantiaca]|uniref:Type VII secretion-associated serine protease mycosin n=1 Tax=Dietzia aurantiaca TaxID=983873 RepID=A0ABV9PNI4_9ACTN